MVGRRTDNKEVHMWFIELVVIMLAITFWTDHLDSKMEPKPKPKPNYNPLAYQGKGPFKQSEEDKRQESLFLNAKRGIK